MNSRQKRPQIPLALMIIATTAGCSSSALDSSSSTNAAATAEIQESLPPVTTLLIPVIPTALTSLPREGEADTYDAPNLSGLPLDEVLKWAEASGLRTTVFTDPHKVESSLEFNPVRLLLLVEDEVVIDAWFG